MQYVLTPPAQGSGREGPSPLLGLAEVIEQMTQHTDGRQAERLLHGSCVLADVR